MAEVWLLLATEMVWWVIFALLMLLSSLMAAKD
jgi:hypothetical protein